MARTNTLGNFLTDVADAIRTKKGSEELIAAEDFDTEIENLPSGGDNPTTLVQLNSYSKALFNSYDAFLKNKINTYNTYTQNAVTLYTPNLNCTTYMIHKRSNGKYRIIWANKPYVQVNSNTNVGFCFFAINPYMWPNAIQKQQLIGDINTVKSRAFDILLIGSNNYDSTYGAINMNSYYSNEFDTIEEIITEIQKEDGNITYTSYTGGLGFSAAVDTPYKIPYTNTNVFDATDNNVLLMSQRISSNETYALKSQ